MRSETNGNEQSESGAVMSALPQGTDRCRAEDWPRFLAMSAEVGRDQDLVQGAGGNSSLKHDGILWVKASGKWLADAEDDGIFVPVALDAARAIAVSGKDDFSASTLGDRKLRPSIETGLHALLPHRVVVHVHSINVLCHAVVAAGEAAASSRLQGMRWHWVPYARPGGPLTHAIASVMDIESNAPVVLILASHGLIVAADSVDEVQRLLAAVERALQRTSRPVSWGAELSGAATIAARIDGRLPNDSAVHRLAFDPAALGVANLGPLYPDHVVFLGAVPVVKAAAGWDSFDWDELGAPYVIVPGTGVLVRRDITANAEAMLGCWAALAGRIDRSEPIVALAEDAVRELLGWDAEKYRQALARSNAS
jgi:rhamnose utilization protein RhaD (predicted bifunctional aldolase and dehydrogenase)